MELRKGYKKTEVGVIPEDWEVKKLGECLLRNPDYGINAAAVAYDDTLPTYLRITDISEEGKYLYSNKVSVNNILSNSYYLEEGDIVFARTGASVGKTYLYDKNDGKLVFAGFLIRAKANPQILDCKYLFFLTQTKTYWTWVLTNSMRSGQPGLNSNEYKSLQISIPNLSEQAAIADALSDADALISGMEKLIAKKRNIKQGTMQMLLTGKKRLAGFDTKKGYKKTEVGEIPEDWKVSPLGKLCNYQNGTALEKYFNDSNGLLVISIGNYSESGKFVKTNSYIDHKYLKELRKFVLNRDDLTMILNDKTAVGTIIGKVLYIDENEKYIFNQRTMRLTAKDEIEPLFLYFQINSSKTHKHIVNLSKPGTQIYVNTNDITELPIAIPKSKTEQTAIATVLSDMDAEIVSLEQKLDKYKMVKQGMMQELLTGKTRLI